MPVARCSVPVGYGDRHVATEAIERTTHGAETNTFVPRRSYVVGAKAGNAASNIFSGWVIRFDIRAGIIGH